jgi:peroxiredoxin
MKKQFQVGSTLPRVLLAKADANSIETVQLDVLIGSRRALLFGVPGAFTPVCTQQHVPDFIANAAALRRSGYELLVCVAPNDPFTLDVWSRSVDPEGVLLFLSDGNQHLARALQVEAQHEEYFVGKSNLRYLLTTNSGRIDHVAVEESFTALTCTRAAHLPHRL